MLFDSERAFRVVLVFLILDNKFIQMHIYINRYHHDYYEKIPEPVDLTKIGQRIKAEEYRDIEILTTDIQLMISNAKKYYEVRLVLLILLNICKLIQFA